MKPIFYNQEIGDTERICIQEPHSVPLSFRRKLAYVNKSTQGLLQTKETVIPVECITREERETNLEK